MPAKPKQIPNIILKIKESNTKFARIVSTKNTTNKIVDVNLTGFFNSLQRAIGLFIHKGLKMTIILPIIKGITDEPNKSIIPTRNTTTPAKNVR